jgi:hypothetical protein
LQQRSEEEPQYSELEAPGELDLFGCCRDQEAVKFCKRGAELFVRAGDI